jgi:hypothetical protein
MEKKNLVEIKKGEEGTGLLIEQDGYISSDCGNNKQLFEDINSRMGTSEPVCPDHFIVSAVFQKFGIENANGRIYPEAILKREVEKYQEKIAGNKFGEKRAIGECYTPDAMVLCEKGWKPISDVEEGDAVYTLNVENGNKEIQNVIKKIGYEYEGNMYHIKGSLIDDIVTPNHGYPVYKKDRKFNGFYTAEQLYNKEIENQDESYIPRFDVDCEDVISLNSNDLHISKEPYKGMVYCIEVPNHTFYVKDNNKDHWSKNCNHPSESVIDLSRVAMNIIELHWEGRTLVGKLEILTSPGFRKYGIISCQGDQVANLLLQGIKIGVSSRGLGTVTNKMGVLYVDEDYEIVCWDVVSEPSTPNAWITREDNIPQQYVESKENSEEKDKIFEELDKFKDWLND